jgi:hypothetical protein
MYIWGITKKYKGLSWWENFMGGHISFGPITIFGANAMNWVMEIRIKKYGVLCFTLPVIARWRKNRYDGKKYFQWHIYLSPNCTPWACTFYRGNNKNEVIRAQIRRLNFGHGFNPWLKSDELHALNNKFDRFSVDQYEIDTHKNPSIQD